MMVLKGKVALVTGVGGSGVGVAAARELAACGAQVIVNYRSSKLWAQEVVEAGCSDGDRDYRDVRAARYPGQLQGWATFREGIRWVGAQLCRSDLGGACG